MSIGAGRPTCRSSIGSIPFCAFLQYGTSERCDRDAVGIPVLRIPNVVEGQVNLDDLKYIRLSQETAARIKLAVGDPLFVRTTGRREYTGRCAVFRGELPESLFASYLIRARLKPRTLSPDSVQICTMTAIGKAWLKRKAALQALFQSMLHQLMTGQVRVPDTIAPSPEAANANQS